MTAKVCFRAAIPAAYAGGLLWVVLSRLRYDRPVDRFSAPRSFLRLSEGRLTAVGERPTGIGSNGVRGALRTQLPWPISPWRVIERLWPVERKRFQPYRVGDTAGRRNNEGNP